MSPELIQLLAHYKAKDTEYTVPSVSHLNGLYLRSLVLASGVKRMLELGTACAYSSIFLLSALRETGGHLTTIEHSEPSRNVALIRLEEAGFMDRVDSRFGDALVYLSGLPGEEQFDAIFIDMQKKLTKDAFVLAWPHLRPGGWMVVDDVRKFRFKMEGFFEHLEEVGIAYDLLDLDADDSVMFLRKPL